MASYDAGRAEPRQARDAVAFGHEVGRVLSDGRIVGRAEPFAKVFPSSRGVERAVGPLAWVILEDIALDARLDDSGRLVSETNVRRIAANLGVSKNTVTQHLGRLHDFGFVLREELRAECSDRYERSRGPQHAWRITDLRRLCSHCGRPATPPACAHHTCDPQHIRV